MAKRKWQKGDEVIVDEERCPVVNVGSDWVTVKLANGKKRVVGAPTSRGGFER